MPEVKNCLTCKWEPEWERETIKPLEPREGLHGGHMFQGKCQWGIDVDNPIAIRIERFTITRVGRSYLEGGISWNPNNCPAHQPKDNSHAII